MWQVWTIFETLFVFFIEFLYKTYEKYTRNQIVVRKKFFLYFELQCFENLPILNIILFK